MKNYVWVTVFVSFFAFIQDAFAEQCIPDHTEYCWTKHIIWRSEKDGIYDLGHLLLSI